MKNKKNPPTYTNLLSFLVPLAFIPFMMGIGRQFTNGGMARMPDAVTTLAAYGLTFGLINLLSSPLMQSRNLGLILVDSRQAFKQTLKFLAVFSLFPVLLQTAIVFTPMGTWIIQDLHNVSAQLALPVIFALMCLIPVPFLNSLIGLQTGLLINARRTVLVSTASLIVILVRISMVFILLNLESIRSRPILLPVLVVYGGLLTHMIILGFASFRQIQQLPLKGEKHLDFRYVIHFFWPLALVHLVVGGSRPLINMLISRGANGKEALAVLAVVFPLANLPYGWVNQNRSLVAAFREHKGSRRLIRKFATGCGLLSFLIMVILFWTPLRNVILLSWIGLSEELAHLCTWPLILFAFFPLAVMVRAYFQGVALVEHRTKALTPSAPSRLIAILGVYLILSLTPLHSAVIGVAALLSGFIAEAVVVRFCIRRARRLERLSHQV